MWSRFHHELLAALQEQSARDVTAYHRRAAARIEAAPGRRRAGVDCGV
ncbi:MAG TPA: hypothetical protein VGC99_17525 [Candidatus Tectomicrobia bacterium]